MVSAACEIHKLHCCQLGFFSPMRERLIIGGEQRLPFMNLGPCSGEDRDKLGVLTPGAPEEENSNSWALNAGTAVL